MDFKSMLNQLSQLSEATKETPTGRVHKAEPGGYGRKFDTDEEGEEKKDDKKKEPAVKRGRGRPKKGADDSGEVKKYDNAKNLQSFMIGNVPKKSKELEKLPKKKHSLKEWIEEVETKVNEALAPGQKPIPVVGKQGDTQQTGAGFLNITDTSPTGQALQKALTDLAGQKKAQIVVPTKPGQTPTATAGGQTNQPGMAEDDEKWIQKAVKHPGAFTKKAKAAGQSVQAFAKAKAHAPGKLGKQARLAQTLSKLGEGDIPLVASQDTAGAGLGAGRTNTLEAAKPDFPDIDNDGNKKESIKKAAEDKKKKKVNESMHKHNAARLMGKAHALAKEGYNCKYEDMDEARMYHEGYKEGLDECYGQQPIVGLVKENPMPATVPGMASAAEPAMEADMEEGNAFTRALAKTPKGGKFSVGGETFTDRSNYDAKVDETAFAFEGWDQELNALLTESEEVNEGMTVSISKGQQGAPDSVSVSAQDGEADALLGLIKHAGLGLFGDEAADHIGAGADDSLMNKQGGIDVVGDHDGMMALIKKVTGGEQGSSDYEEEGGEEHGEEGHDHEHTDEETCNECGYMESDCQCEKEPVDEVESEDQMAYEVAEDNPPDSGAAEEEEEIQDTAQANASAADSGGAEDLEEGKCSECGHDPCDCDHEESVEESTQMNEWANQVGKGPGKGTDAQFEQDIEFMTKFIAGGLNKPKSTGQTTVPVVSTQVGRLEDPIAWARLAGIKK